jgi:hypothetical protein
MPTAQQRRIAIASVAILMSAGPAVALDCPPCATWACYAVDMNSDGTAVRFRGQGDDVSVGRFVE